MAVGLAIRLGASLVVLAVVAALTRVDEGLIGSTPSFAIPAALLLLALGIRLYDPSR